MYTSYAVHAYDESFCGYSHRVDTNGNDVTKGVNPNDHWFGIYTVHVEICMLMNHFHYFLIFVIELLLMLYCFAQFTLELNLIARETTKVMVSLKMYEDLSGYEGDVSFYGNSGTVHTAKVLRKNFIDFLRNGTYQIRYKDACIQYGSHNNDNNEKFGLGIGGICKSLRNYSNKNFKKYFHKYQRTFDAAAFDRNDNSNNNIRLRSRKGDVDVETGNRAMKDHSHTFLGDAASDHSSEMHTCTNLANNRDNDDSLTDRDTLLGEPLHNVDKERISAMLKMHTLSEREKATQLYTELCQRNELHHANNTSQMGHVHGEHCNHHRDGPIPVVPNNATPAAHEFIER